MILFYVQKNLPLLFSEKETSFPILEINKAFSSIAMGYYRKTIHSSEDNL